MPPGRSGRRASPPAVGRQLPRWGVSGGPAQPPPRTPAGWGLRRGAEVCEGAASCCARAPGAIADRGPPRRLPPWPLLPAPCPAPPRPRELRGRLGAVPASEKVMRS